MNNIGHSYVTDTKSLGMQLRIMRVSRRLSLQQVAEAVGVNYTTLSRFELNERDHMKVDLLLKLCEYYGLRLMLEENEL